MNGKSFARARRPHPSVRAIVYRKNRPELRDPSQWRIIQKALEKVTPDKYPHVVETPSGLRMVVKEARAYVRTTRSHDMSSEPKGERSALGSAVLFLGKRIRVETPLATYVNSNGTRFHVYRFVKGMSGQEAFNSDKLSAEKKREIGLRIAETIGTIHRNHFLHGHPHQGNFIIDGKRTTVLDFKQALTREEVEKKESKKLFVPKYREGYANARAEEFYFFIYQAWHVVGHFYLFKTTRDFDAAMEAYFKGYGQRDETFYRHIRLAAQPLFEGKKLSREMRRQGNED